MVKDTLQALSLGLVISVSLRLLDIILGQQIILALAFLTSAFVAGGAADYGGVLGRPSGRLSSSR